MRDRGIILTGLALFLGLVTFPAWYNLARGATSRGPDIKLPATEKQCVAPTAYMRASHMDLLVDWREQVVREGNRTYRAPDGKVYTVSLTGTCMLKCHTVKEDFCDRCHNYAAVRSPYCWDCHVDPKLVKPLAHGSAAASEPRPSGSGSSTLAGPLAYARGSVSASEPRPSGSGSSTLAGPLAYARGSVSASEPRPSGSGSRSAP